MGKAPAFPLYAADFDMDTATWENDEIGAYLRLLLYEWVNGGLPDDTYKLSKIVRESQRKFVEKWKNLSQKFTLNGNGLLINKRLEEVRQNQAKYSESRRKNVSVRYQDKATYVDTHEEHMKNVCNLSSSSISSSTTKDNNKRIKHIAKPQKTVSPEVKIFIDFYHEEFKKTFGTPPLIQGGKDGKTIKDLLLKIPLKELKGLLISFFDSEDPFIEKSGYTIGVFKSQINKLKIGSSSRDGTDLWLRVKEEQDGRKRQENICVADETVEGDISIQHDTPG